MTSTHAHTRTHTHTHTHTHTGHLVGSYTDRPYMGGSLRSSASGPSAQEEENNQSAPLTTREAGGLVGTGDVTRDGKKVRALTATGTKLLQQRQMKQAEKYLLEALELARAMQVSFFPIVRTNDMHVDI